jgi:hypothetical protein
MTDFRVIVTGGRNFNKEWVVFDALAEVYHSLPDSTHMVVVHGDAGGADAAASLWAKSWERTGHNVHEEPHAAAWSAPCRATCPPHRRRRYDGTSFCPAAGVYRNGEMVELGADLGLVFPGDRGTADCARRISAAGIAIRYVVVGDTETVTALVAPAAIVGEHAGAPGLVEIGTVMSPGPGRKRDGRR